MDIFSYAKTPNEPLDPRRALLFLLGGATSLLGFGAAAWHVLQTGSVPTLLGMTGLTGLGLFAAFRFTLSTMRLSARAANMAWDFADEPPRELLPAQRAIFDRLVSWKRDPVSEGGALGAMWGGVVLALVPLGMLVTESVPANMWGAVAGLAGVFTSLLLVMTTMDYAAVRPVVGILARAQLERLEAGTGARPPAPHEAERAEAERAARGAGQARPRPTDTRR